MVERPRVLSLCAGYGGLDLGVRLALPGARTVGYVERDVQAAALLVARMREGRLDDAPIWSDLLTFPARRWRGAVDLVVGGFPCQPFSTAGKRRGLDDERWLWPAIARIAREARPAALILENVSGFVTLGLEAVLRDLAALGFDAEWGCYRASDLGATHRRERWFCLAYARRGGAEQVHAWQGAARQVRDELADADLGRRQAQRLGGVRLAEGGRDPHRRHGAGRTVANAADRTAAESAAGCDAISPAPAWPPAPTDGKGWAHWSGPQPVLRRDADGFAVGLDEGGQLTQRDRLRLLGNGVVPQQATHALRDLIGRIGTAR